MAQQLQYLYEEVLLRCGERSTKQNIVAASECFAPLIHVSAERLRKNKQAKKMMKNILKTYLIVKPKKNEIVKVLSKTETIHMTLLLLVCLENDVLTKNKQGKFFNQIANLWNDRKNYYQNDEHFVDMFRSLIMEISAVALVKCSNNWNKTMKDSDIGTWWTLPNIGFGGFHLA
jgi:hypothetical protein